MTNQAGLAFEQGVQIFFIQKILAEEYGRLELVGDGDIGDSFFTEWSNIVRGHDGEQGFSCTVNKTTINRYLPENKKEEVDVIPSHNEKLADFVTDTISQFYIFILDDPGYSDLLILLSDKELGQLMRIEYSATIAGVSKQQDSDLLSTDDDVIIKNAIAENLGKEPQDLKEKDYDSVTGLSLYGKKITDIKLLEQCKNLITLHLSGTGINDISALKGLTNLTQLWLDDNQISNISPLNGLTNLTHLWISSNQISDISSLKGLTKLMLLDLNKTKVNDLTPIRGLDKLTHLGVSTTQLDNIQAVSKLTNLRLLGVTNTNVGDLGPLKDLNNLDALFFSNTQVKTLEPLEGLKKLTVLSFKDTDINDLEPLKKLANLQTLKMQKTSINSLEPLKELIELKELLLEGCENITIEQIDELQKVLPDCKIPAALIKESFIINRQWRLFFNPKVPGLSKTKIMRFGKDGAILEGKNNNEFSWRIRNGFLELLDSDAQVHSRFYYNPDKNRFSHTNDPDTGSIRKHSIRDQYMLPEK